MKKRIVSGVKVGFFVFIGVVIIAIFLNVTGLNIGHNRIWSSLGNLELINIFEDKELNGLIVLSFILGFIAFILGFSSFDKVKKSKKLKDE
ncbi:hypothetical protein BUY86_12395 [Staphylococcus equorum]|uniref:hypothetical protein n=1 Tax=Staphylococcus equorum TaxID=246432 RepID=UPI000E687454|nr:hypothetical protein [Staphylococcus equorum]RIL33368.1 hypothetical protein BUY86_12395 [Staphylococcus equorum]